MTFNNLLKQKIKELWKINIKKVMIDANKKNVPKYLQLKITNQVEMKSLDYDIVINKIKKDELYASFFAKDPLKQNVAKKLQLELLQKVNINCNNLPTSGKNTFYLNNGKLTKKKSIDSTKSLDFYDEKEKTFYYAKYTNENGGAQDNQYNDVKKFIKEASKYCNLNNDNYKFVLLIDGNYYTKRKIKCLTKFITNKKVSIINSHI